MKSRAYQHPLPRRGEQMRNSLLRPSNPLSDVRGRRKKDRKTPTNLSLFQHRKTRERTRTFLQPFLVTLVLYSGAPPNYVILLSHFCMDE